jgi:hypothetical protein
MQRFYFSDINLPHSFDQEGDDAMDYDPEFHKYRLDDVNKQLQHNERKIYIMNNIDLYEQQFLKLLNRINFEEDHILSNIFDLFYFIGELFCLRINPISNFTQNKSRRLKDHYSELSADAKSRLCILPNKTGFFGMNTFLYAFLNGIYLIGIPVDITTFHDSTKCSAVFLEHDIFHAVVYSQFAESTDLTATRVFYDKLIFSSLDLYQKEICLFILFYELHELATDIISHMDSQINFRNVLYSTPFVEDFVDEAVRLYRLLSINDLQKIISTFYLELCYFFRGKNLTTNDILNKLLEYRTISDFIAYKSNEYNPLSNIFRVFLMYIYLISINICTSI